MKHKNIIEKMTLEEKAAFLSGKGEWQTWDFERLGIPSMYCSDGPHGIRKQAGAGDHLGLNPSLPATCFSYGSYNSKQLGSCPWGSNWKSTWRGSDSAGRGHCFGTGTEYQKKSAMWA